MRYFLVLLIFFAGCCTEKQAGNASSAKPSVSNTQNKEIAFITPAAIIYKTKKDYHDKVPVIMNDDRTKIVSYPAPADVLKGGVPLYPTPLDDGYLLDNIGIGGNTVFLDITLEEYSKRAHPFSMNEMMQMLLDKDPFVVIYDCGQRRFFKSIVSDLNNDIANNHLAKYKRIL